MKTFMAVEVYSEMLSGTQIYPLLLQSSSLREMLAVVYEHLLTSICLKMLDRTHIK